MTPFRLPTQTLAALRLDAAQSFDTPVSIYEITIENDRYAQQVITSGLLVSTSGYVGRVRGSEAELFFRTIDNSIRQIDGTRTIFALTLLVPIGTPLDTRYIVVVSGIDYRVVWHTTATQENMQLYEKAIITRKPTFAEKDYDNDYG